MENRNTTFRPHLLALLIALPAIALPALASADSVTANATVSPEPFSSALLNSALQTKVMNGEVAKDIANDLLPWQAAIQTNAWHASYYTGCGAVIISDYWAVTAAHCLEGRADLSNTLIAGTTYIPNSRGEANKVEAQYQFNIVESILHPNYNGVYDINNDIGLIKVDRPLTSVAKPIKVASPQEQLEANQAFSNSWNPTAYSTGNLIASGWGNTEPAFWQPDELMVVKLAGIPMEQCDAGLPLTASSHFVCADSNTPEIKKDVCAGDSGGPLVWQNPNHASDADFGLRVVGVTSFGPYCEEKYNGNPFAQTNGLYTELAAYYDWIMSETGLDLNGQSPSTFSLNPFEHVRDDAPTTDGGDTGGGETGGESGGGETGGTDEGKETETSTSTSSGGGSMPATFLATLLALAYWRRKN
ncbi:serine protease [Photobacterium japonica]|uniref:serine protease n=1 Tax=Photobacterium japonica TaxID=2910235 RepID=UPI003D098DE7